MPDQKREWNKVCFAGRVPQDPEMKYWESGSVDANFAISISQGKNEDGSYKPSIWIDCKAKKDNAEWVAQNVRKGARIYVVGKMSRDEWISKQDGQKRGKNYVFAFEVGFDDGQGGQPRVDTEHPGFMPVDADDIAF